MNDPISELIFTLDRVGFFRFLLPFIITFAIFYGLLRKSKIFGEPKENIAINATISLASAFLVSAAPILAGIDITKYLAGFLIYMTFVIVSLIVIFFLPFIFKPSLKEIGIEKIDKKIFSFIFLLILVIFIIVGLLIFGSVFRFPTEISEEIYSSVALLIFIFIFSIIIYFSLRPQK